MSKSFTSLCLCSLMIIFMLSGCIEEYDAELPDNETKLLVVEGRIHPGQCVFRLRRSESLTPYENEFVMPYVIDAELSIVGSDDSYFQLKHWGEGIYIYNNLMLDPDVKYSLHIKDGNDTYESDPQYPLATEEIKCMIGRQNTSENNIDVLITTEAPSDAGNEKYYRWEVYETWEVHPEITTTIYYDFEKRKPISKLDLYPKRGWKDSVRHEIIVGSSSRYDRQQIQNLRIYDIDRANERIYYGYSADVIQRAISKGEYEYELARRQAGYEMGGLFSPLSSSLPSNIRCTSSNKHVIGYVGCSLFATAGRLFLAPNDFSICRIKKAKTISHKGLSEYETYELACDMQDYGWGLCGWNVKMPESTITSEWARVEDLDVRWQGAYIDIPYFWPTGDYKSFYQSIPYYENFHNPYYDDFDYYNYDYEDYNYE